jgi:undecaprenyl-diphosphatase
MDWSLTHHLNDFFAAHDGVEDPATWYANAAEALFLGMLILAFVVVLGLARHGVRRAVVSAGVSAGVALAIGQVIARIADRPRPFVAHPGLVHLFTGHAADAGFPSDHTTAAFAIGVALLLRYRIWGIAVLAFGVILAVVRVGIGLHYPSDVIGGALLGTLTALALWLPPARRLLDQLADAVGRLVDGAAAVVLRRPGLRS